MRIRHYTVWDKGPPPTIFLLSSSSPIHSSHVPNHYIGDVAWLRKEIGIEWGREREQELMIGRMVTREVSVGDRKGRCE